MRLIIFLFALLCVCAAVITAVPLSQDQEDVRGAFLTSRPKEKTETPSTGVKPSRRRPRPAPSPTPRRSPTPADPNRQNTKPKDVAKPAKINTQRLGLGLTLFSRDSNGLALRVDPTHVFHKRDRVRILLETNSDGYLYIFNTTDNGPPVMVYPNPELDDAGNYLHSPVPLPNPSRPAAGEQLPAPGFQ